MMIIRRYPHTYVFSFGSYYHSSYTGLGKENTFFFIRKKKAKKNHNDDLSTALTHEVGQAKQVAKTVTRAHGLNKVVYASSR